MDNQPSNIATTIQAIGRCRRNALLYRDDVDILSPENKDLLEHTRECYVYYNVTDMKVTTDLDGELQYAFCNHISCEELKAGTSIEVVNGQLPNGLYVIELGDATGKFNVIKDVATGFNIISPCSSSFYDTETRRSCCVGYGGRSCTQWRSRELILAETCDWPIRYLPDIVF